jgi:hypothetical protein
LQAVSTPRIIPQLVSAREISARGARRESFFIEKKVQNTKSKIQNEGIIRSETYNL